MYEPDLAAGFYLLKQEIPNKGFDHYAVGVIGVWLPEFAVLSQAVAIDLSPIGIRRQWWLASGPWTVLNYTADVAAASARMSSACRDPRYRAVDNNCEQFARWVVTGRRESRQVQGVVLGLAAVGLVAWAARKS